MVVAISEQTERKAEVASPLWYVPDRRIRTEVAARQAVAVADWIETRSGSMDAPTETELFVALHTCAYRAAGRSRSIQESDEERFEWERRWEVIRSFLVEENLGLAYSMIKRFGAKDLDRDDLRSEALWALMRAVDRFNPWLECKFSTYACNAIRRALVTHWKKVGRYRRVFPVQHDGSYEEWEQEDHEAALYVERLQQALDQNLAELTALESKILARRFPMDESSRSTLQEIGDAVGLSNERVRQLQNRALNKLRSVLGADPALQ